MQSFFLLLLFFFTIMLIMLLLMLVLNSSEFFSINLSSFECGFSSSGFTRSLYTVHFFQIMLIFVIFDLEVVLLLYFFFLPTYYQEFFLMMILVFYMAYYFELYVGSYTWLVCKLVF